MIIIIIIIIIQTVLPVAGWLFDYYLLISILMIAKAGGDSPL
jgi:hypothetical protein